MTKNKKIYKYISVISLLISIALIANLIIPSFTMAQGENVTIGETEDGLVITTKISNANLNISKLYVVKAENLAIPTNSDQMESFANDHSNELKGTITQTNQTFTHDIDGAGKYYAVVLLMEEKQSQDQEGNPVTSTVYTETISNSYTVSSGEDNTQTGGEGEGQGTSQGEGQGTTQGEGQGTSQGEGQGTTQGEGQGTTQGEGQGISQGEGQGTNQGEGQEANQGEGQGTTQGEGQGQNQTTSQEGNEEDEDVLQVRIEDENKNNGDYTEILPTNTPKTDNTENLENGNTNKNENQNDNQNQQNANNIQQNNTKAVTTENKNNNAVKVETKNTESKSQENIPQTGANETGLIVAIAVFAIISLGSFIKYRKA